MTTTIHVFMTASTSSAIMLAIIAIVSNIDDFNTVITRRLLDFDARGFRRRWPRSSSSSSSRVVQGVSVRAPVLHHRCYRHLAQA